MIRFASDHKNTVMLMTGMTKTMVIMMIVMIMINVMAIKMMAEEVLLF